MFMLSSTVPLKLSFQLVIDIENLCSSQCFKYKNSLDPCMYIINFRIYPDLTMNHIRVGFIKMIK